MIGESLEQHCSVEFNRLRPLFKNAYFEKDNDARSGSKGDFIFRDYDDDNNDEDYNIIDDSTKEFDEEELNDFGNNLKEQLEIRTKMIYEMAGEEFNINSTKQLGEILFEKMKLPVVKKTKSGYSTDVDVLEKLKLENPIIQEILD